jgi:hypothetical protein
MGRRILARVSTIAGIGGDDPNGQGPARCPERAPATQGHERGPGQPRQVIAAPPPWPVPAKVTAAGRTGLPRRGVPSTPPKPGPNTRQAFLLGHNTPGVRGLAPGPTARLARRPEGPPNTSAGPSRVRGEQAPQGNGPGVPAPEGADLVRFPGPARKVRGNRSGDGGRAPDAGPGLRGRARRIGCAPTLRALAGRRRADDGGAGRADPRARPEDLRPPAPASPWPSP